jgi:hypothetical protein
MVFCFNKAGRVCIDLLDGATHSKIYIQTCTH